MDFDYHVLKQYYPALLEGLAVTLAAVTLSLGIAIAIGIATCVGNIANAGVFSRLCRAYVDLFRVIPDIVLVFWVYFCLPPIFGLKMSALTCGVIALSLGTGAYLSEIFRAGILAVPHGQAEACDSLALPRFCKWSRVIMPQAVRRMLPTFVNAFTELLKHTTLLSGIGVAELTYQAHTIGAQTFRYVELLTAVAVCYFVVIFPLSLFARYAEARLLRRTGQ
jgi:His/Glu/Gln/Arg/opine family amino acid ABC transporter permease subunit